MVPTDSQSGIIHIHLDPLGGLSGDMFLAAVLDTWPDMLEGTVEAMRAAGLPNNWLIDYVAAKDHGLTGSRLNIIPPKEGKLRPTGSFRKIRKRLEDAPMRNSVKSGALRIFTCLAEAEAKVHGVSVDEIHFHEIADWDSVADIVGAAHVIEVLREASWSIGPLPLGNGRVDTEHGPLPVPAPATTLLLQGLPVIDDGIGGERVTPTGAAIARSLTPTSRPEGRTLEISHIGTGFGARTIPGIANALRVLAFHDPKTPKARNGSAETIGVICFEIDDQTPEDLAIGLQRISDMETVHDVKQWPVYGKKGRISTAIQILCEDKALDAVGRMCFLETTTIGLRRRIEERTVLDRTSSSVLVNGFPVRVKKVLRPGGRRTVKAEADSISESAGPEADRSALRRKVEAIGTEEINND